MKTHTLFAAIVVVGLLESGVAIAADSDTDRDHPATFVKDSAITTAVKAKLTADHASDLTRIHVDTDKDGVVWLSGTVESAGAASRAVTITKSTDGVRSVHNDIKVKQEG